MVVGISYAANYCGILIVRICREPRYIFTGNRIPETIRFVFRSGSVMPKLTKSLIYKTCCHEVSQHTGKEESTHFVTFTGGKAGLQRKDKCS